MKSHPPKFDQSPLQLLLILSLAIFISELASMFVVSLLPPLPQFIEALIDALLLSALVLPMLYMLEVQPLRRVIAEREQAEADLMKTQELLEHKNKQSAQLAMMSSYLQACNTEAEAYDIIKHSAINLAAGSQGAMFIYSASRNELEMRQSWGELILPAEGVVFPPDECWALRRGQVYCTQGGQDAPACKHYLHVSPGTTVCAPMMAHGEALGVIYMHTNAQAAADSGTDQPFAVMEESLARAFAEQAGLALANLQLRESLRSQSIRDPLTGLFNRRYLEETLEREVMRARRGHASLAVVMFDIDHFKCFNDEFGHDAGDVVMRELGVLLRQRFRGSDIACRYGGEEFTVILPDISSTDAYTRIEELRVAVENMRVTHEGNLLGVVTISSGIAIFPANGYSGGDLIHSADQALYAAKNAGRNQTVLAQPS